MFFIVDCEVYKFDVMVSVDESDEVLLKRLKKYGNSKEDCSDLVNMPSNTTGRCAFLPSGQTVIRLRSQPNALKQRAIICHETFHATTFILDCIGMTLQIGNSDEAYAYFQEYLFTQICLKLKL